MSTDIISLNPEIEHEHEHKHQYEHEQEPEYQEPEESYDIDCYAGEPEDPQYEHEQEPEYQEPEESYDIDCYAGGPEDAEYYAVLQENNFCEWEHQVQNSIQLARSLLNGKQELDLISQCTTYLENQYNMAHQEKFDINSLPLVRAELRNSWDQKLFDFIRTSIWKYLTKHIHLNDGCFPPNEYNKTSNAIFEAITPDIYNFASKAVKLAPAYTLGY